MMSENDDLSLKPRSSFELRRQEVHEQSENVSHGGRLLIQPPHASPDEVCDRDKGINWREQVIREAISDRSDIDPNLASVFDIQDRVAAGHPLHWYPNCATV